MNSTQNETAPGMSTATTTTQPIASRPGANERIAAILAGIEADKFTRHSHEFYVRLGAYLRGECPLAAAPDLISANTSHPLYTALRAMALLAQTLYGNGDAPFDDLDQRILAFGAANADCGGVLALFAPAHDDTRRRTGLDPADAPRIARIEAALRELGVADELVIRGLLRAMPFVSEDGVVTATGRAVCKLCRDRFEDVLPVFFEMCKNPSSGYHLTFPALFSLFLTAHPQLLDQCWRLANEARDLDSSAPGSGGLIWRVPYNVLLEGDPERAVPWVRALATPSSAVWLWALTALLSYDARGNCDLAIEAARHREVAQDPYRRHNEEQCRILGLDTAYACDPDGNYALVEECALDASVALARHAVEIITKADTARSTASLRCVVADGQRLAALDALAALLARDDAGRDAFLLAQLTNRSRAVREAVALWSERQGKRLIPALAPYLAHTTTRTRALTARVLGRIGGAEALALLTTQLAAEKKADIRQALQDAIQVATLRLKRTDAERALLTETDQTLMRKKTLGADWFDLDQGPPLHWQSDGEPLPLEVVRYCFYRLAHASPAETTLDARVGEIVAGFIDRATASDFAVALVSEWRANKEKAKEGWVLMLAGALGAERLIPTFRDVIERRGTSAPTLALKAAQALALVGSDAALLALDDLSLATAPPWRQVRKLLADVAEARGIAGEPPADTLMDAITPTLGLDVRGERVLTYGGKHDRRFTVKLSSDGALKLSETVTGKPIKSLPNPRASDDASLAAAARETYRDIKQQAKDLRLLIGRRLEHALVTQRAWELADWRARYLTHPLLRPAACTLVWGVLADDGQGGYTTIFRPLEDGTLTDVNDEPIMLPENGWLRLVHPAELTEEQEAAWRQHLADYEVTQVCAQFSRLITRLDRTVDDEGRPILWWEELTGTIVRPEQVEQSFARAGWFVVWTSVTGLYNGKIGYRKDYSGNGDEVVAYVRLPMLMDRKNHAVQGLAFVRNLSIKRPSYFEEPPLEERDGRLLPLSDVPPGVVSDIIAELRRFVAGAPTDPDWRAKIGAD